MSTTDPAEPVPYELRRLMEMLAEDVERFERARAAERAAQQQQEDTKKPRENEREQDLSHYMLHHIPTCGPSL